MDFLQNEAAEIVCFQELKANETQIDQQAISEAGYAFQYYFSAQKKGYSGVGILCKTEPKNVVFGCGHELFDFEGRVIRADFEDFSVISVYFPSGASGDERQEVKMQFLTFFYDYIQQIKQTLPNLIIVGDYNIAHQNIDIHDPKGNAKSTGFLPEERNWLTEFLALGFSDGFRYLNPDTAHAYTWWSMRFPTVRQNNKGWRIDYQLISNELTARLKTAYMLPNEKHSDHCSLVLELFASE